jgi:MFS family permease
MNEKRSQKFYGWKLVAVFFSVYFLNGTFPYYGGVVINSFMSAEMGMDRSTLGLGFSIFTVAFGLSSPLVGSLVTRIGARRTLLYGCAVLMTGTLLMAFGVTSPWHYKLYFGVIIGVGVSLSGFVPILSSLSSWFRLRKATAMAIVMSASGMSALISAPLLAIIIGFTGDWRFGWMAVTITVMISTIIVAFGAVDTPAAIGQHPDGIDPRIAVTDPTAKAPATRVYQSQLSWSVSETFRSRSWWLLAFASFAFLVPFNIAMGHGVVHLLDLGHSEEMAGLSIGLIAMFSIAGRLWGGWLGDRIEPRFIWSVALAVMFAGTFLLKNASGAAMVYAYAAMMGISMGASLVCMITLTGNYYGSNSYPKIIGWLLSIGTVLAAISPILAGVAYDRYGSYESAFYGAMFISLLGAVLMPFATPPKKKTRP